MQNFKEKIKEIDENYTELILDTQSQTLSSIETNSAFATPLHRQAVASPSTSNLGSFFEDDFSQEDMVTTTSDDVMTKISQEVDHYARIKLTAKDKESLNLLNWWKTRKNEYPYLFKAVKALLCTPATSVPSERVFSEAGYISRARRSRILPFNLNNTLFIKKNMHYMPDTCLTQEQAS
ncbi:MAG: hAT transposon family protein, partial [Desulfobacterales bacterium]|nr:hAT transposon family protein [Desulfobacterales bacterium]